nr:hypothetical protein CFP56_42926 [Quercus suber]
MICRKSKLLVVELWNGKLRKASKNTKMASSNVLEQDSGYNFSIPPPETPKESQAFEIKQCENNNNRGVGIDLNLRLGLLGESEEEEESLAENGNNLCACSVVVGKVSAESTYSMAESAPTVHVDHVVAAAAKKSSESECDS